MKKAYYTIGGLVLAAAGIATAAMWWLRQGEAKTATLYFNVGDTDIDNNDKTALNGVAKYVARTGAGIMCTGHTDSQGSSTFNEQLGMDRANAVADYLDDKLVELGVDSADITVESQGESEPVGSNDTDEGKALNRRVEVWTSAGVAVENT